MVLYCHQKNEVSYLKNIRNNLFELFVCIPDIFLLIEYLIRTQTFVIKNSVGTQKIKN